MSISKPESERPINPCKKFIKFKGGTGIFQFYDKELEKEIPIKLPMTFMVIDELSTITGWHDESQSSIYSNEVHSVVKEDLKVRAFKGGDIQIGKYKDIKDKVKAEGGKYAKSVYAMDLETDEIVNFQFTGAACRAWFDKEVVSDNNAIKIEKMEEGKKGSITYKIPVFEPVAIDKEIYDKAVKIDEEVLRPYFKEYKAYQRGEEVKEEEKEHRAEETDFDLVDTGVMKDDWGSKEDAPRYTSDVKPSGLPF